MIHTTYARLDDTYRRLRRPEYTGENRCLPCTAANLAIAGVLAVALAALWMPLALLLAALALGSIWLRGYLVPGTPELTKRYFPDWLLARFDELPSEFEYDPATFDVEGLLFEADAIGETPDGDVALVPSFAADLRAAMDDVSEDASMRQGLAEIVGVDDEDLELEYHGAACRAFIGDELIAQWESRAAFVADLAAHRVLEDGYRGWLDLPVAARSQVIGGLRLVLDTCPVCEGEVVLEQRVVQSCCREYPVVAATCRGCGARLFESRFDAERLGVEDDGLAAR